MINNVNAVNLTHCPLCQKLRYTRIGPRNKLGLLLTHILNQLAFVYIITKINIIDWASQVFDELFILHSFSVSC